MELEEELDLMGQGLKSLDSINFAELPIDGYTSLNLHFNRLTSLHGLPVLHSLTDINLSSNNFLTCNLPELAKLTALVSCDLSGNKIESLNDFPFLPGLQKLSIAFNFITSMQGLDEAVPQLEYLDLRGNSIAKGRDCIAIQHMRELQQLQLAGSQPNPICSTIPAIAQLFELCSSLDVIDHKTRAEWAEAVTLNVPTPHFDRVVAKFKTGRARHAHRFSPPVKRKVQEEHQYQQQQQQQQQQQLDDSDSEDHYRKGMPQGRSENSGTGRGSQLDSGADYDDDDDDDYDPADDGGADADGGQGDEHPPENYHGDTYNHHRERNYLSSQCDTETGSEAEADLDDLLLLPKGGRIAVRAPLNHGVSRGAKQQQKQQQKAYSLAPSVKTVLGNARNRAEQGIFDGVVEGTTSAGARKSESAQTTDSLFEQSGIDTTATFSSSAASVFKSVSESVSDSELEYKDSRRGEETDENSTSNARNKKITGIPPPDAALVKKGYGTDTGASAAAGRGRQMNSRNTTTTSAAAVESRSTSATRREQKIPSKHDHQQARREQQKQQQVHKKKQDGKDQLDQEQAEQRERKEKLASQLIYLDSRLMAAEERGRATALSSAFHALKEHTITSAHESALQLMVEQHKEEVQITCTEYERQIQLLRKQHEDSHMEQKRAYDKLYGKTVQTEAQLTSLRTELETERGKCAQHVAARSELERQFNEAKDGWEQARCELVKSHETAQQQMRAQLEAKIKDIKALEQETKQSTESVEKLQIELRYAQRRLGESDDKLQALRVESATVTAERDDLAKLLQVKDAELAKCMESVLKNDEATELSMRQLQQRCSDMQAHLSAYR